MIKICDYFSIPISWQVIFNYFLWLLITTHPQSGPTWASVFSPQSCAILPIYRWSGCLSVFKQGYTLGKISSLFKKDHRITGGPSSSCEMIILRNNSHGGIIRACRGLFTTALRNKKIRHILKKKSHLTSIAYCLLSDHLLWWKERILASCPFRGLQRT